MKNDFKYIMYLKFDDMYYLNIYKYIFREKMYLFLFPYQLLYSDYWIILKVLF